MIRERVEVAPRAAPTDLPKGEASSGTALCGEPAVGTLSYVARGGPSRSIWFADVARSASAFPGDLAVTATCGGGAGLIANGLRYTGTWENHAAPGVHRHNFAAVDSVLVSIPLRPLDRAEARVQIPAAGLDANAAAGWVGAFGCSAFDRTCMSESPHEVRGGALGIQRRIDGAASAAAPLQPAWPDTLTCGTAAPVPLVAVRGSTGVEGWLDPDAGASLRLPQEGNRPAEERAALVSPGDATAGPVLTVVTDYAAVRTGRVVFVAPPCAAVREPRSVLVQGSVSGVSTTGFVRVAPPPPVALDLRASPDTVAVDGPAEARVRAIAVGADGAETWLDAATEVTFAAQSEWLELRQADASEGGPARTLPYEDRTGDDARRSGAEVRIPLDHHGAPAPQYDAPVRVSASGGGVAGDTLVVVRGTEGPGPDSLAVSLGAPDVPCGDSTWVSVAGLLGGVPRAVPDSALVRLVVKDSTVARLAWGDRTGAALAVPIEAIRDGAVWVRTENCDGLDGDVPVLVSAEVDAYWDPDGVIAGEGSAMLPGGGSSGDDDDTGIRPVVRLLHQNDSLYTHQTAVVSRFAPDADLLRSVAFASTFAGRPTWYDPFTGPRTPPQTRGRATNAVDAYTLRPEASGIPSGAVVSFRMEVFGAGGSRVQAYPAVEGVVSGDTLYRADRHVRFVATTFDDARGSTSPDQTVLVSLGDSVRFTVVVDGAEMGGGLGLRVGLPPVAPQEAYGDNSEDDLPVRMGTLNWRWHDGAVDVQPALTAERANERWAQAGVTFGNRLGDATDDPAWGAVDFPAVRNVMFLRYRLVGRPPFQRAVKEAPESGEIRIVGTVGGALREARVPFAEGAPILQTTLAVTEAVEQVFGVPVSWFQDASDSGEDSADFIPVDEANRFYLVVGDARSAEVILDDQIESTEAVTAVESLDNRLLLHHAAGLAAARGDGEVATIDVFVLRDRSLVSVGSGQEILGKGIGYRADADLCLRGRGAACERYSPIVSSLFVYDEHVDTAPDFGGVMPHEVGHVLAGGGHPATLSRDVFQTSEGFLDRYGFRPGAPLREHVMFGTALADPATASQRRFDFRYVFFARYYGQRGPAVLR